MSNNKNLHEDLKEKGLIGFLKDECNESGCRNLETRCKDCNRLVNTANLEDILIRNICNDSPSHVDLNDPTIIAIGKDLKGYSAKDLMNKDDGWIYKDQKEDPIIEMIRKHRCERCGGTSFFCDCALIDTLTCFKELQEGKK